MNGWSYVILWQWTWGDVFYQSMLNVCLSLSFYIKNKLIRYWLVCLIRIGQLSVTLPVSLYVVLVIFVKRMYRIIYSCYTNTNWCLEIPLPLHLRWICRSYCLISFISLFVFQRATEMSQVNTKQLIRARYKIFQKSRYFAVDAISEEVCNGVWFVMGIVRS